MKYSACPHCSAKISPLVCFQSIYSNKIHCGACQQDAESPWELALRGAAVLALLWLGLNWGNFVHSALAAWVMGAFFVLVPGVIPELLPLRKNRPASLKGWGMYVLMFLPLLVGVSAVVTLIAQIGR